MREGKSPQEACLEVLKCMSARTRDLRLLREDGRPNYQVTFYALAKDRRYGSAAMWFGEKRPKFAVYSDGRNRLEKSAYLFES